jgi:hypothetical protein
MWGWEPEEIGIAKSGYLLYLYRIPEEKERGGMRDTGRGREAGSDVVSCMEASRSLLPGRLGHARNKV